VLNLNGNDFELIPNEFKNLLNVEELFLENEKKLNFTKALLALERLPKLKKLHLDGNALKFSPVGLNNLVALQELYLGKNPINLKLNDINHLGNLKSLHLTNNGITSLQSIKEMENFGIKVKLSD
jgi:Leucine-rich repeat (LRR) protein